MKIYKAAIIGLGSSGLAVNKLIYDNNKDNVIAFENSNIDKRNNYFGFWLTDWMKPFENLVEKRWNNWEIGDNNTNIIHKTTGTTRDWHVSSLKTNKYINIYDTPGIIFDNKRSTSSTSGSNPISGKLGANEANTEANDNYNVVDFLSDGWRVSGLSASDINYGSGYPKQIYMSFAEESSVTPFNTFPNAS